MAKSPIRTTAGFLAAILLTTLAPPARVQDAILLEGPRYTGVAEEREVLTGDWSGLRSRLAERRARAAGRHHAHLRAGPRGDEDVDGAESGVGEVTAWHLVHAVLTVRSWGVLAASRGD